MNEFNVERVFFHELGHYVANRTNQIHLDGFGVKEVRLFPFGEEDKYGHNEFDKPANYIEKEQVEREKLPQFLAGLCYGCFFQSYYVGRFLNGQSTDDVLGIFQHCFNKDGNGSGDAGKWRGSLTGELGGFFREIAGIENDYFTRLLDNNSLDGFMELQPRDYLELPEYKINLYRLNADCQTHIADHSNDYMELIGEYRLFFSNIP